MTVRHQFVSTKPDGNDSSKVKPSQWNEDHEVIIDLASGEVIGVLPMAAGGTGANNAYDARINLELGDLATQSQIDLSSQIYNYLPLDFGGTGAGNAADARFNLELGDLALQSSLDLGAQVNGILQVEFGGTGSDSQAGAINNLLPYQGWYGGYFLYTDGSNVSWQYAGDGSGIEEAPYDGNKYARQYNSWVTFSEGGGSAGMNIYINGAYQGFYGDLYFYDNGSSSGNYLYGADGNSGGGGIGEAPYDGNYYARQNYNWVAFTPGGGGSPGGNHGDVQFNYYGSFYSDGTVNYDFSNHCLTQSGDYYGYTPRQINRASYYQYSDIEQWQDYYGNILSSISHNGGFKPAQMYDWDAENNSLYYSYNYGKLVFKDAGGSTYELY